MKYVIRTVSGADVAAAALAEDAIDIWWCLGGDTIVVDGKVMWGRDGDTDLVKTTSVSVCRNSDILADIIRAREVKS